jgi:hypothetical protein
MDAITANELLTEFANRHAHYLQGVINQQVKKMLALLRRMDADILGQLANNLGSEYSQQRLEALFAQIRHVLIPVYERFNNNLQSNLKDFTDTEISQQAEALNKSLTGGIDLSLAIYAPAVEQVFSAAMSDPMQGRTLAIWADSLEAGALQRISDTISMGYAQGQTTGKVVSSVREIFPMIRRDAEAVVRTAIGHFANFARDGVFQANSHVASRVQWSSTLDGRTTLQWCVPRAGKLYDAATHKPIGHKLEWGAGPGRVHWNCRSTSVAITSGPEDTMLDQEQPPPGARPYVAFQTPTDKAGNPIVMPKPAAKMSVAEYSRLLRANGYTTEEARAIEQRFIGAVPDTLSYNDFLKQQAAKSGGTQFIKEVLGQTRARLFLEGKLSVDRFSNNQGYLLTLDELRQRHAAAWNRTFGD